MALHYWSSSTCVLYLSQSNIPSMLSHASHLLLEWAGKLILLNVSQCSFLSFSKSFIVFFYILFKHNKKTDLSKRVIHTTYLMVKKLLDQICEKCQNIQINSLFRFVKFLKLKEFSSELGITFKRLIIPYGN